jgi:hypothetical protein
MRRFFEALAAFAALGAAESAQAETLPQPRASYSAEQIVTADGQSVRQTIYHDRGKERREMRFEGAESILIVRPDQACAYSIGDGPNTLMIDIGEAGQTPFLPTFQPFQATREGEEILVGETVTRYAVKGPGPDGEPVEGKLWVTADGILMKSEMLVATDLAPTPVTVELAKVERKTLPGSLFEPPADKPVTDMRGEVEQTRPMGSSIGE